jgi:GT2 family glycosyltransferase
VTSISVIIPAYRAQATLPLVLEALEPQVEATDREVVLVDSTGAGHESSIRLRWPWVRLVAIPQRMLPGRARNLGASIAHGDLLAFLDADAIPQRGWLDKLECALAQDVELVAGAVLDGTPDEGWGTVSYVLEFMEWVPQRRTPLAHGPGCNLLIRRTTFDRAGGFAEDLWPGEDTVFSVPFANSKSLAFAPEAQVTHLNRVERREVLAHQRRLGASWVEVCARVSVPGRRLAVPRLAAVAVAGRGWSLSRQLRREPGSFRRLIRHSPLLVAALLAWGAGVARPSGRASPESSPRGSA